MAEIDITTLEYRMYFLVPYNISPIQQAIQAGHAVVEYGLLNFDQPEYQKWAKKDKTFILLNGGTFNDGVTCLGTMNQHLKLLTEQAVRVSEFREPDLNNGLSAIAFLVDERVFDKTKYPNPEQVTSTVDGSLTTLAPGRRVAEEYWTSKEFQAIAGGYHNAFLRGFLQDFRLA